MSAKERSCASSSQVTVQKSVNQQFLWPASCQRKNVPVLRAVKSLFKSQWTSSSFDQLHVSERTFLCFEQSSHCSKVSEPAVPLTSFMSVKERSCASSSQVTVQKSVNQQFLWPASCQWKNVPVLRAVKSLFKSQWTSSSFDQLHVSERTFLCFEQSSHCSKVSEPAVPLTSFMSVKERSCASSSQVTVQKSVNQQGSLHFCPFMIEVTPWIFEKTPWILLENSLNFFHHFEYEPWHGLSIDNWQTAQRAMERKMWSLKLQDKIPCWEIRKRTKIIDIMVYTLKQTWRWARHLARMKDNRWTKRCTEWQPRRRKRLRGQPCRRWQDDITRKEGTTWIRKAIDRGQWKTLMEGYVLLWMAIA